jgi:hypothetical protein
VRRSLLAVVVMLATFAAAPAIAPAQAPTLTQDIAFAPPTGIARGDFREGTIADLPAAVAVDGDRIYTVGRTQAGTGGQDIGIMARRTDGTLDPGFSDDGKLIVPVAPGGETDSGTGIVVLPDHRIRVIGVTDIASSGESLDVALLGFNADGTPDTSFGALEGGGPQRSGRIVFPAGPSNDVPNRIVAGPGGRLAITGSRSDGVRDDTFVSLREADGTPVTTFGSNGVKVINRGGSVSGTSMNDWGADVAFRPGGGLLTLIRFETNPGSAFDYKPALRALTDGGEDDPAFSGDADLVVDVGTPDTIPGGLVGYGGRFYLTGYTRVGADTDAFLARVEPDGSGLQTRLFDMRGRVVAADQAVVSQALDLDVVPGAPATLVVAGSVDYAADNGSTLTDWAAAAFNHFDGALADAGFGDVVLQAPGSGRLLGVAPGPNGWAAVAGTHIDSSIADNSFGNARLLIDADKQCDLALTVAEPAEVTFRGLAPAEVTATVRNVGTRTCGGTLGVPAPYRLGAVSTGPIAPGASMTASAVQLAYDGPRRAEDVLQIALAAPDDRNEANNLAAVHVVFSYCNVALRRVGSAGLIPNEGARRFDLLLRNTGTAACRIRVGGKPGYSLRAGQSASDRLRVGAPKGAVVGKRVDLVLRAGADGDVDPRDDAVGVSPRVVGVGDSDIRRAGARGFAGTATKGRGEGVKRKRLRAVRVEVAVLRRGGKRCSWLASRRGGFAGRERSQDGRCTAPRWLRADGVKQWRFRLRQPLPGGRYRVYSRATIAAGFPEARFSEQDRNMIDFTVR